MGFPFFFSDINECEVDNPCNVTQTCQNLPGTFSCSCPAGYVGDGEKHGTGCSPIPSSESKFPLVNVALGKYLVYCFFFVLRDILHIL